MFDVEGIYRLGLVGNKLTHSFSKTYFENKFKNHHLTSYNYQNFETDNLEDFIQNTARHLKGFNVTIPYKEQIMKYLDVLDDDAVQIGAVNTVKVINNQLKGYNTDWWGFQQSVLPLLQKHHTKALILGTGGAAKAVRFAFDKLHLPCEFVSTSSSNALKYSDLTDEIIQNHTVIVNTTPLGMFPNIDDQPPIPTQFLTSKHLVVDLIYNPEKTWLLQNAELQGSKVLNGLTMLTLQAEKSWEVWQSPNL